MAYWMVNHYLADAEESDKLRYDPFMRYLSLLINPPVTSECAAGVTSDKQLDIALNKIDNGIKDLLLKYPGMSSNRAMISSGTRGTRYFIEFPITGKNVDAFSLLVST